jgi:hypothetical protein
MKASKASTEFQVRAAEALQALLGRISGVRLNEIKRKSPFPGCAFDLLAQIDVYGHSRTLACKFKILSTPRQLRIALNHLCIHAARIGSETIPVLISPCLSSEAQELCKQARTGYLDLEGNARLNLGEVFIGLRSHPCRNAGSTPSTKPTHDRSLAAPGNLRHFPSDSTEIALIA